MHNVKFGLFLPTGDFPQGARPPQNGPTPNGFYSVSINDHFFSPLGTPQTPQLECFSTLSAVAAITKNVAACARRHRDRVPHAADAREDRINARPSEPTAA